MTWIKLEDEVIDHPKIAGLSDVAFRWWIRSLCYASRFLTDGVIPGVFLIAVKPKVRSELIAAKLWIERDSILEIHDYLKHQTSKADVEKERERNRSRRRGDQRSTGGGTAGTPNGRTSEVPRPEAEADTQIPENQIQNSRSAPLIQSHVQIERRRPYCAFIGSRIEVPNGLHAELRKNHGGTNPEKELQAWYVELNGQAEDHNWRIPTKSTDFYPWFKDLYAAKFPPTPVNGVPKNAALMARLEAIDRGEIKR